MADPIQETPRTNWIVVTVLFLSGLFAAAQFGKLTLTLELMRATYPDARAFVPSLVSIIGVVGLIFAVVAGGYVVRFGAMRMLVASMVISALMSFVQAALPPVAWFTLSRIIEGFAHLVIVVACPTLIASHSSDSDRPFAMGIWASFFGVSYAVLALVLPGLLDLGGLPAIFIAHGAGFAILAVAVAILLPAQAETTTRPPSLVQAYREVYTTPRLLIPGAGFVWYTGLYIALIAVLPVAMDLPPVVISGLPIFSIFGTVGAGYVAKFVPPERLVMTGFVLTALIIGLIWMGIGGVPMLYALFLLMGMIPAGSFASIPHFNASLHDRARSMGGVAHFGNIGTTFGTPVMVLLFDTVGFSGVAFMTLACCAAGFLATAWLIRKIH